MNYKNFLMAHSFWSYDFVIVHNPPDTKAWCAIVVLKGDITYVVCLVFSISNFFSNKTSQANVVYLYKSGFSLESVKSTISVEKCTL